VRSSDAGAAVADLVTSLALRADGPDRFVAVAPEWWGERVFGGMVVAHVLRAAAACVDPSLRPHSLHGYFLRPVAPGVAAKLVVERDRDSRSFATRTVTTTQEGRVAARMTCSFCVEEDGADEYQLAMPGDVPAPGALDVRAAPGPFESADVGPLRAPDGTYVSSGRFWNRTVAPLPDDPVLHACVLALLSDMTRTSFRPGSLERWGSHSDASIDHALWFHRPARADRWLLYDLQAVVNRANRATVRGTMFDEDGSLVLSMAQELVIRPVPGGGEPAGPLAERF
jgi:acyl-CoA thioesterase II